ncbi:MAG: hypothetical protein GF330_14605 [Candidatus Eisenbacteria bacterium]|nr:hypothetical protein [Candidatus Eisenbacteria bacterium]
MAVEITLEQDVAVVHVHGRWAREDAEAALRDLAELARKHAPRATLLDLTRARIGASVMDTHETTLVLGRLFPHTVRHAVVVRPGGLEDQLAQFGENVAVNRGIKLKLFDDLEAAMHWAREPSRAPNAQ